MRVAAWTASVTWFLICTLLSFARFARHMPPAVLVQPGAIQPPPNLEPAAAAPGVPADGPEPENSTWDHSLDSAPERIDVPAPSAAPENAAVPAAPVLPAAPRRTLAAPLPSPEPGTRSTAAAAPQRAESAPGRRPRSHKESTSKVSSPTSSVEQPARAAVEPAARCLECGAPAASWVEVDGKRMGYCRKHYSRMDRPRASRKRARSQPQAPALSPDAGGPAAALEEPAQQDSKAEAASVQCRGLTKDGTRCRRKTKDPSGFCYQHRPR